MRKPEQSVPLVLKFEGPDVDDGSMSIEDVVPVLQGFASAYGKMAAEQGAGLQHRIRITAVRPGSTNIVLEVWERLGSAADALTSLQVLGSAAVTIVGGIIGVIRLKKHLKNRPHTSRVSADNTVEVTNSENVTISMPVTVFNVFQAQTIDADIAKIVSPLREGRINSAEVQIADEKGVRDAERIDLADKPYLSVDEAASTKTEPSWLTAQLNSLTKTTNSGFLNLTDGARVFYTWMNEATAHRLHRVFGTHSGLVRVWGVAYLDASLRPLKLEIDEIEGRSQR